jgi:hypothetical protein
VIDVSTERVRAHRARKAAGLLPDGGRPPLPAEDQLASALGETLAHLDLGPEHAAARKLAQRYAKVIDESRDQAYALRWIGPLLLACLAELGATPTAKAQLDKGTKLPQGPNRLDQLRAARTAGRRPGLP